MSDHQLPTPQDDRDRKLLADIEEVGWSVLAIWESKNNPGFAYSLGIYYTLDHPEIIIMGLPPKVAHALINTIGDTVRAGQTFEPGQKYDDIADGFPVAFVAMDQKYYREYLGYGRWFYHGSNFPVLQCVWPDKEGIFPWEPGYDSRYFDVQRVLGGRAS